MALLHHHALIAALAKPLTPSANYAVPFLNGTRGGINTRSLPAIGDLDFRQEVRVNLQNHIYGNFIGGNSDASLETFCFYHRHGEIIAYFQALRSGKSIFKAINPAELGAIGKWLRVGAERIGDTIYGLVEGRRVWAEQVGVFTIEPINYLNISYRGGGGGGADTQHYLDWLTLDLGTGLNGKLERWIDFSFNEPDGEPVLNRGKLGGVLDIYGDEGRKHILLP